jgi:hypothetical protein
VFALTLTVDRTTGGHGLESVVGTDVGRRYRQVGNTAWHVPLGAILAVRRFGTAHSSTAAPFPVSADAAQFLMDARNTRGFVVETSASIAFDRTLSRQIALHGNYVIEGSARLAALPETGSLIIVAPGKNSNAAETSVRVLAMVG